MERGASPVLSAPATDAGGAQAGVGRTAPRTAGRAAGRTAGATGANGRASRPAGRTTRRGRERVEGSRTGSGPRRLHTLLTGLGDSCALVGVALLGCLAVIAVGTIGSMFWTFVIER